MNYKNKISYVFFTILAVGMHANANNLNHIQSTNEIELCANPDAEPFSLKDAAATGFQIDIAEAIASELGVSLKTTWIINKRDAKKTDCDIYAGVANMGTGDSKYLKLTDPFFRIEFYLVTTPKHQNIVSLDDLRDTVVGVTAGSIAAHKLQKENVSLSLSQINEIKMLDDLINGSTEFSIVSNISATWYKKNRSSNIIFHDAEAILNENLNYDLSIGLRKSDQDTKQQFNKIISDLKSNGKLDSILIKYGLQPHQPTKI